MPKFFQSIAFTLLPYVFVTAIATPRVEGATLAEVNHVPITDTALNDAMDAYLQKIGHRKLSISRMDTLKKEILKRLIEEELLYQEALKTGLAVTDEEIEAGLLEIRSRFPNNEAFETALSKEVLTLDKIRKGVERSLLVNKTWRSFADMTETKRSARLREITKNADIQINANALGEPFVNN
ncbi:MAG: SurA N-terminal domain-containing protein [Nitrospiria bacterium]